MKIYNLLVNRYPGIRDRYHKKHDNTKGRKKFFSYLYLIWLNISYYILRNKVLESAEETTFYEEKKLLTGSESKQNAKAVPDPESFSLKLMDADVVSFDVFDTLILRPFSAPTDLFWFLNDSFPVQNLKDIRIGQEYLSRRDFREQTGCSEVSLRQIWDRMESETGIPAEEGMKAEESLEMRFCYSNPYMKKVFQNVLSRGKQVILISDMYLSADFLKKLLMKCGYQGFQSLYVSCEYGRSKADGQLFEIVKQDFPEGTRFIHVGDNPISDCSAAIKAGMGSVLYPNINRYTVDYRVNDISPIIGGAYRGIVNNHLYNGMVRENLEYEYGYIYGGLFVIGYCNYIHRYVKKNKVEKVLFLSRDGEVLKEVYDRLFPDDNTAYVYWSRAAATKLMASWDRYDYFERYVNRKIGTKVTVLETLHSMDLDESKLGGLPAFLKGDYFLEKTTADVLKEWLQKNFDKVLFAYEGQRNAASCFYRQQLEGIRRAVAVDIGWAGSGALALSWLCNHEWKIPCEITGIIAGTNTLHNAQPYATERFRQRGKLVSYLYSPADNRDLLKKHDPNRLYNVYWELLLSSTSPHFRSFDFDDEGNVIPIFGKTDPNPEGIQNIRRGILDFVDQYTSHFKDMPEMFEISGRDAYAPMLAAASRQEKYLRNVYSGFAIDIGVD